MEHIAKALNEGLSERKTDKDKPPRAEKTEKVEKSEKTEKESA